MLLVVAVVMATELDIRFENRIAADLPAILVNPSKDLEEASATRDRLADLRGGSGGTVAEAAARSDAGQAPAVIGPGTRDRRTRSAGGTRRATARSRCGRCAAGSC